MLSLSSRPCQISQMYNVGRSPFVEITIPSFPYSLTIGVLRSVYCSTTCATSVAGTI
jgi:hypothetical protein